MEEEIKISVIIPIYNAEHHLYQAIKSVLDQSFEDFEILAINDGSTDTSLNILYSFKDKRLKIINNSNNRGIIYSLNRGIELAKGKYIARMDADDIAKPDRFGLQVDFLENNPNVALVGGCAELIDQDGHIFDGLTVPLSHDEIFQNIFSSNCFIHPSVMLHTSSVRDLGGYNSTAIHAEDYDLWLRIIKKYQVSNLKDSLIQYRIHPSQVSQKKIKQQRKSADTARFKAFEVFQQCHHDFTPSIVKNSHLDQLTGKDLSIGGDYMEWIETYRKMGRDDLANELLLPALLSAPLSSRLYQQVFIAFKKSRFINTIKWYKNKITSSIKKQRQG